MSAQNALWVIIDSSHFGGIESHILQLSIGLTKRKISVHVIFLNDYSHLHGPHPLLSQLRDHSIPTQTLDGRFYSLKKLIKEERPSLCHAHGYKAGIYTRFAGILTSTPCITTYHAGEQGKGKLRLYDLLDRSTALLNSSSTAVSDLIAKKVYAPCTQMNNFIETNGLDLSCGKSIGFVGRLSEEKDPECFVKLAHHFPSKSFCLFGDGPLHSTLSTRTSDNCSLRGHVNMNDHWGELKCLIICSKFEGLPLCLLEAMARGIVVVAYDLGQISKVIEHEQNGFLVPKGDFLSLKKYLYTALSMNKSCFMEISQKARNTILSDYSTNAVLPRYIDLYTKHARSEINNETLAADDIASSDHNIRKPLTILFVHYGENWIRGSEICLINLVTSIQKHGVKPLVWCNSQVLYEELKHRNIEVVKQRFSILLGWQKPRFDLLNFAKLIRSAIQLIKKNEIDLIHTNGGAPNQWMLISARKTSTPILTQLHAPYLLRDRISLYLKEPDIVVGVSEAVIKPFSKDLHLPSESVHKSKYRVIHNGIGLDQYQKASDLSVQRFDLRKELNISNEAYVIISIGSLIHRKGFDLLIDSVSFMRNKSVDAHLVIIGDGSESEALKAQSIRLGLAQSIHFLGERKDVSKLLQSNVDVYASGARDEAFGLVLAEAGAAGLASVAPHVGGIPEVIVHKKSGILVEPNSSTEIAEALITLHKRPLKRIIMGSYAQDLVFEKFALERNTHKFLNLYEELKTNKREHFWGSKVQAYLSPLASLVKLSLQRR